MEKLTRKEQKELMRKKYVDYDPRHHDAFVLRLQKEEELKTVTQYMKNRGIE